ncbi:MAG: NADPH-dependent F420 reductase [Solirubrobacterales bacterium]
MTVGILGAGNIGQAIAKQMLRAGQEVMLANNHGPESLAGTVEELGPGASAGTMEEAAAQDMVAVAIPWGFIPDALEGLPDWNGRIVIDANNAVVQPDFKAADLGGRSSSEVFAEMVPGARVVKTANILLAARLGEDPVLTDGRRVLFISGDDQDAKVTVSAFFTEAGFRMVDLGDLSQGRLYQVPGSPLARSLLATD